MKNPLTWYTYESPKVLGQLFRSQTQRVLQPKPENADNLFQAEVISLTECVREGYNNKTIYI